MLLSESLSSQYNHSASWSGMAAYVLVVSKCGPQTVSITWELIRNSDSQTPLRPMESVNLCCNKPPWLFWYILKFENPCSGGSWDSGTRRGLIEDLESEFYSFICLCIICLGLHGCLQLSLVVAGAYSPAVLGFSLPWFLLLQSKGSRHVGLVPLRHVGSSRTRDPADVPYIARWSLNHWTTREAQIWMWIFRND